MKKLNFLVIDDQPMFACLLLGIIEDLFRGCQVDATDILGVPGKLLENRPDVVICGHENDFREIGILQGIKARHPAVMTILEGVSSGVTDEMRLKVDYIWRIPYDHQKFKKAIETFFGKEG